VRRDYPDRDHPKLLEHVVDQFVSRPPAVAPAGMTFYPNDTIPGFVS
jgi:hypothetical protein